MRLRPLGDVVLVRLLPLATRAGGLHLPGSAAPRVRFGRVLAVGPGAYAPGSAVRTSVGVAVGERVAFFREHLEHQTARAQSQVLHDLGEDLALLRGRDILYVEDAPVRPEPVEGLAFYPDRPGVETPGSVKTYPLAPLRPSTPLGDAASARADRLALEASPSAEATRRASDERPGDWPAPGESDFVRFLEGAPPRGEPCAS